MDMADIDCDARFRVIFVGDSFVGKTSVINRFVAGRMEKYICGLAIDFDTMVIEVEGKHIKLHIWDTAGQERFRALTRGYYRGADGVIVVYSVNDQESFDHVTEWLDDVAQYCGDDVNKVLVGNKCDLKEDRVVDYSTAQKVADSLGIPCLETSALEDTNVEAAFLALAGAILDRKRPEVEAQILLNAKKEREANSSGCCY